MQPLQIPRKGWYDIFWRTYQEMQQDRLLSIAGGVSFFAPLAIFPAITALVSAYGLFFNPATIANDIGQLSDLVPANVLTIVPAGDVKVPEGGAFLSKPYRDTDLVAALNRMAA